MSQPIIETRGLSLKFTRKEILSGLNFSLQPGEWAVIAGRNGAGKSTLLRCLAGVFQPDAGAVVRSAAAKPEKIGFISDRLSLFEDWTIGQSIDFHCRAFRVGEFDDRNIALPEIIKAFIGGSYEQKRMA